MGSHTVNVHGTLTKNKLDKNGKIIGQEVYKKASDIPKDELEHNHGNDEEVPNFEVVKSEILNEEGCQVFGHLYVNKVPGNFHISSHAYGNLVQQLASMGLFRFDISHTINHLSFGDVTDMKIIRKAFDKGILNPLDNHKRADNQKKVYEYYLKVIIAFLYFLFTYIFTYIYIYTCFYFSFYLQGCPYNIY